MMKVVFMFDRTWCTASRQTMQELFYCESLERFSTRIAIKKTDVSFVHTRKLRDAHFVRDIDVLITLTL